LDIERINEIADPEVEILKGHGSNGKSWGAKRKVDSAGRTARYKETRNKLTNYWKSNGV
jgi:hypothetical protein